jgi:radical SAM superfamily enzyme YgiQ (UPF0313 family)
MLSAEDWVLPDVLEIPYSDYQRMYQNDLNKYCGIPECLELVVPVARGCPIGCSFCDVPAMQGLRERRLSVIRTVSYIEEAFLLRAFDYVAFYAPTFTLNRTWVMELCKALQSTRKRYPWKCATTLAHLDRELLCAMSRAGCVRVSVGIETLDSNAGRTLPLLKRDIEKDLQQIASECRKNEIEMNCFVIFGLPGDTYEGVKYTIDRLLALGVRIRPTVYTPYHQLRSDMTIEDVSRFNRHLFLGDNTRESRAAYYRLLYANKGDKPTNVTQAIRDSERQAKV